MITTQSFSQKNTDGVLK